MLTPNIGEVVLRRDGDSWVEDWVLLKLLVIGKDRNGGDIHEPAVLWWGFAYRRHIPGQDEWGSK